MARGFRSGTSRAVVRVGAKRETIWFSVSWAGNAMTALGGTIYNSLNAAALALRPFTVIRTRLLLQARSDQTAATEDFFGAFGMAVVSDQAVAAGVASIPTPITDLGSDLWFVHQMFAGGVMAGGTPVEGNPRVFQYTIDSKAMRRVDVGEDIVQVGEVDTGAGNGTFMAVGGRMLVKAN